MRSLTRPVSSHRYSAKAFSLVELLTVMALVAMLMAVGSNIVRGDTRRADVNQAVEDLGGILRTARWEARSKATFVWVCFRTENTPGREGVRVTRFASKDGTPDSSAINLLPLGQSVLLKRITLGDASTSTPARLAAGYAGASVATDAVSRLEGATLTISGGAAGDFSDEIVAFNPRGEASIPGASAQSFIEVLLAPSVSGTDAELKTSSLLVSRATGAAQAYR